MSFFFHFIKFVMNCLKCVVSILLLVDVVLNNVAQQWNPAITKCHGTEKNVRCSGVFVILSG